MGPSVTVKWSLTTPAVMRASICTSASGLLYFWFRCQCAVRSKYALFTVVAASVTEQASPRLVSVAVLLLVAVTVTVAVLVTVLVTLALDVTVALAVTVAVSVAVLLLVAVTVSVAVLVTVTLLMLLPKHCLTQTQTLTRVCGRPSRSDSWKSRYGTRYGGVQLATCEPAQAAHARN